MELKEVIQMVIKIHREEGQKYINLKHTARFDKDMLKEMKKDVLNTRNWDNEKFKYKYEQEAQVNKEFEEDTLDLNEKHERRDNCYLNTKSAGYWKEYYIAVYQTEGNIDIPKEELGEVLSFKKEGE
jgi:hypothetical protein